MENKRLKKLNEEAKNNGFVIVKVLPKNKCGSYGIECKFEGDSDECSFCFRAPTLFQLYTHIIEAMKTYKLKKEIEDIAEEMEVFEEIVENEVGERDEYDQLNHLFGPYWEEEIYN